MNLILIGGGGYAGVLVDAIHRANEMKIRGILDDTVPKGEMAHGYEVLGPIDDVEEVVENFDGAFFIAIGDPVGRHQIWERIRPYVPRFMNIRHPEARIVGVPLCEGTFFGPGSHLGNRAKVGDFSIINTNAVIEHDSAVGAFVNIAPGVVTGGWVNVGDHAQIGLGACVRDRVRIGAGAVIGMGSVVVKDMPERCTAWGNPCEVKEIG